MRKRMRLEWSAYASADRSAIFDYIEADRPRAAAALPMDTARISESRPSLIEPLIPLIA
jgi:plasmid stabilization system protein ParE